MIAEEQHFLPVPTRSGLVDEAADTAHVVAIMRQRVFARGPGSPTADATPVERGLFHDMQEMAELQSLLFGSTRTEPAEPAVPQTPGTVR